MGHPTMQENDTAKLTPTEQKYKKEADKQFSPSNVLFSHRMKKQIRIWNSHSKRELYSI